MNKKILIGGSILLLLALGGGGAWWILHRPTVTATPKPYIRQLNFKSCLRMAWATAGGTAISGTGEGR